MKKLDYIAKLTIYGLPNMSKKELSRLENWLNEKKNEVYLAPQKYSKRFTARLMK